MQFGGRDMCSELCRVFDNTMLRCWTMYLCGSSGTLTNMDNSSAEEERNIFRDRL
jgi:hypothetical protein